MPIWYESQRTKDLMPIFSARAVRGIEANFFLSRIYTGKSALLRVARYLEAVIDKEERRALIITDSFTIKFVKILDDYLKLIDMDYEVWSGVLPEAPVPTIEEGLKVCESYNPKIIIAIGGGA